MPPPTKRNGSPRATGKSSVTQCREGVEHLHPLPRIPLPPWYLWPLIALVWTDSEGPRALAEADDPALRVAAGPDAAQTHLLSTRSISTITGGHLTGRPPQHPDPQPSDDADLLPQLPDAAAATQPAAGSYTGEQYTEGIAARRHAVTALADINSVLDDVDRTTAELDAHSSS